MERMLSVLRQEHFRVHVHLYHINSLSHFFFLPWSIFSVKSFGTYAADVLMVTPLHPILDAEIVKYNFESLTWWPHLTWHAWRQLNVQRQATVQALRTWRSDFVKRQSCKQAWQSSLPGLLPSSHARSMGISSRLERKKNVKYWWAAKYSDRGHGIWKFNSARKRSL